MSSSVRCKSTFVSSKDGTKIETKVYLNPNLDNKTTAAIISHPYGPLGGNMQNNVVSALVRNFCARSFVTVCFNFRGCGNSGGRTSWTGRPECEDYNAVVNYIVNGELKNVYSSVGPNINIKRLIICGYSYGAMIASSILPELYPNIHCSYVFISYPVSVTWFLSAFRTKYFHECLVKLERTSVTPTSCNEASPPKILVISGDMDIFSRTMLNLNARPNQVEFKQFHGADHFWFGKETEIIIALNEWLDGI
ncbi:uncharacterized protein VTP21DRAFT_7166 [Calcarisporiella thermophila]|uniref:uncharacterized protein n=1 Tax=Calcarisporiella thermophila TaxID=911321 RepID=UPI0037425B59